MEISKIIESYNEYVKKIPTGSEYISNFLNEDKLSEAFASIKDFSEGLLWLSEASELMKKHGVRVDLNIEKIQEFLKEINNGLEKQDYILVADMFEYEIAPFFINVELAEDLVQ